MRIVVKNTSPHRQTRTVSVMLPGEWLAELPRHGTMLETDSGDLVAYAIGDRMGEQRRLYLRMVDMPGDAMATIEPSTAASVPDWFPWPAMQHDWLLDVPTDMQIGLEIRFAQTGQILRVPYVWEGIEETTELTTVWRLRLCGMGWHSVIYLTMAKGQDVVDYQGTVTWDPRGERSWDEAMVDLRLYHGEGNHMSSGQWLGQGDYILEHAVAGTLPRMFAIPFYGAVIGEVDVGTPDEMRRLAAEAARGGDILAKASVSAWSERIGPHKANLAQPLETERRTFDASRTRDIWADRLGWGPPRDTGRTGDYGVFGRIKALDLLVHDDPELLQGLRWGSTDLQLRGIHFLDHASMPMVPSFDDDLLTYGGMPHYRVASGAWNLPSQDPPWGALHGRAYIDPQHRGNLFAPMAAIVLGDWVLRDCLHDLLATDTRDVRIRTGAMDAARHAGRILQEWAWWHCAANERQRQWLRELAERMLQTIESRPTMQVAGPVAIVEVLPRTWTRNPFYVASDPDSGWDMWAPWQQSFVVDGCVAWADLLYGQDQQLAMRFLDVAVRCARSVVEHGMVETPNGWIVGAYVRANDDGEANAREYWQLPRSGAQTDLVQRGGDLVYGGISPYWYSGAAFVAAHAGSEAGKRFRNWLVDRVRNQSDQEWLVGGR